jgi:hypothetical protein
MRPFPADRSSGQARDPVAGKGQDRANAMTSADCHAQILGTGTAQDTAAMGDYMAEQQDEIRVNDLGFRVLCRIRGSRVDGLVSLRFLKRMGQ